MPAFQKITNFHKMSAINKMPKSEKITAREQKRTICPTYGI